MKNIKYYLVKGGNADDRGWYNTDIGAFMNHSDAVAASKGVVDGYGGRKDGRVVEVEQVIYENLAEFESGKNSELRKAALAKLSKDERDALGV